MGFDLVECSVKQTKHSGRARKELLKKKQIGRWMDLNMLVYKNTEK